MRRLPQSRRRRYTSLVAVVSEPEDEEATDSSVAGVDGCREEDALQQLQKDVARDIRIALVKAQGPQANKRWSHTVATMAPLLRLFSTSSSSSSCRHAHLSA